MSPILMRPVREQLEHDRVIRLLQAKYRRKFEVAINPGAEQTAPIPVGQFPWYPDLLLQASGRGHKVLGVVEVETAESVNKVEAMSQWATFSRLRAAFHLYVPASSIDVAKRLCLDLQIPITEMWAYHAVGDQIRFTLVQRAPRASDAKVRAAAHARGAMAGRRASVAGRARGRRPAAARSTRRAAASGGARRKAAKTGATRAVARKKTSTGRGTARRAPTVSRAQKRK